MTDKPCSICGEVTAFILLGWFGECPNCQFAMEVFGLSPDEIKKRPLKPKESKSDKDVRS